MRILSFDQATRVTGYALFVDTGLVNWGCIDCSKLPEGDERINQMILKIYETIRAAKPDVVVFENVQLQTSPKTLMMLTRIQGAIMGYCLEHGIIWNIYMPTQWRKILGFSQGKDTKRKELKKQAIEFACEAYNIQFKEDIAESVSIGLAYLKSKGLLSDLEHLQRKRKNIGEKPIVKQRN